MIIISKVPEQQEGFFDSIYKVVVEDFGLAKALLDESTALESSATDDSPTITDAFTRPGTILGTAA